VCLKRRISRISQEAEEVPKQSHMQVKVSRKGMCVYGKGLRFGDKAEKTSYTSPNRIESRKGELDTPVILRL